MLKAMGMLAALLVAASTALAQGDDEFRRRAEEIERKFERAKKEMMEQLELERRSAMEELDRSRRKAPKEDKERGGQHELGDVQGAIKELFGLIRELRAEIEELRSALRGFHGKENPPRDIPTRKAPPPPPKHAPDKERPGLDEERFHDLMRAAEDLKRRIHDAENDEERAALKNKLDRILRQVEEFKGAHGGGEKEPPRKREKGDEPKHPPDGMDRPDEGHLREMLRIAEELKRRLADEENDEERGALKEKLGHILRQLEEFRRGPGEEEKDAPPKKKDKREE